MRLSVLATLITVIAIGGVTVSSTPSSASNSVPLVKEITLEESMQLIAKPTNTPKPQIKETLPKPQTPKIRKIIDTAFKDFKQTTPDDLHLWVAEASNEYDVSPRIILSLIERESGFRERVVRNGNVGLMQVRPKVWSVSKSSMQTGRANVMKGTAILADYRSQLGGSMNKALQAYNVGITAFNQGKRSPTYARAILHKANSIKHMED